LSKRGISTTVIAIVAIVILVIAAVGVYYLFFQPPTTPSGTIKIGLIGPLTGEEAWIGYDGLDGAMLAVEEINAAGGVNGRELEIVYYDDGGSPEQAVSMARKLIDEDHVVAGILDHGSDLAMAASGVFEEAKVPALVPWAGHPDIVKGNYTFRVGLSATAPGNAMSYYAYSTLGKRKLAVVCTVDAYEESYAGAMKAGFVKLGGEVVYDKLVEWGEKEYTSMLTELKATGADVILGPHDFSMSIPFTNQARGLGITAPIFYGSSSSVQEYIDGVGQAGESGGGIYVLFYMQLDDPVTAAYTARYQARYGKAAGPTASYTSYDCVKIIAQVVGQVGDDHAALTTGIKGLTNFVGVGGTITKFDRGEDVKPVPIYTIQSGAFTLAKLVTEPQYISPFV